jgi:hypothetical protein
MANTAVSCPKCRAVMEKGFAVDRGHYNLPAPQVPSWVAGPWSSQPLAKRLFGDALSGRPQWPITGYRCSSCGYLEAYAK